jgi:macrolide transport system ATP-binding/permease protein
MLVRQRRFDADLEAEMRLHVELRAQQQMEASVSPDEARYAAQRRFGNALLLKESSREMWGWRWLETLLQDLQYALRMLGRSPGFTAAAVLSLAVGVGATTAMFSLSDALLLRPLPVERPGDIVRVFSASKAEPLGSVSYPDYVDFRDQTRTLAGVAGYNHVPLGFSANPNTPAQIKLGAAVTANFFGVLGVKTPLGRGFQTDDDREQFVVLSDSFWESHFARDPSVIGRKVRLSKLDFTVIGVASASFPGLQLFIHEAMYVPMGIRSRLSPEAKNVLEDRDRGSLFVYGRLAPGRTTGEAQAEFATIARHLEQAYPDTNRGRGALALPELEARLRNDPEVPALIALLLSIAALVMLIACANVANLLLARARVRAREIAIRLAIGAGRGRLLRQLLTESLLLSLFGGAAGLVLATAGMQFLSSIRPATEFPVGLIVPVDQRVLLFSIAASLLSVLFFGLAPALQMANTNLTGALKAGDLAVSGKKRRWRMRNLLVVGQVAVSLVLLVAAGLLLKDFTRALHFRPGFRTDHMLVMTLDPALVRYQEPRTRAFYAQLMERLRILPGVRSVALGEHLPLGVTSSMKAVVVEGFEMPRDQPVLSINCNVVDEQYFATLQIPIESGRPFDRRDIASAPAVAIVNETMARRYWPNRSALGGRIRVGDRTLEVTGIAKDIKYREISEKPMPFLYLPFSQNYESPMTLHVEAAGDPAALTAPVIAEIHRLDPDQPVAEVGTLHHFFEQGALFINRLIMQLVTTIGLFGLLLATVGLYGVVAYSVSRRTREIGIRIAIGAGRRDVLRLVLRQGTALSLTGVALGLGLALSAAPVLESQLVGVSSRDLSVFLAVPLLLVGVSLMACYVPARRAASIEPLNALREE